VITRRTFIAGIIFGFVAAPGAGVLMAEQVADGRASTLDIAPYRLERFGEGQALRLGYPKAGGGSRSRCTPVIRGLTGVRMGTMIRIGEQDRVAAVIQGGIA
jgi:hypothetical protein